MNDGDTLLVVADKTIIQVAERNMQGIVPLYYNMRKAEPIQLTNEEFYNGMVAAWTGGNIGEISNNITKIWNNSAGVGEDELLAVKLLCMENNFVIDYAKTLYKPKRPEHINKFLSKYTQSSVPYFFIEAKGYPEHKVEPINDSFVNSIRKYIKKKRLSFKRFGVFSYRKLMTNPEYTHSDPDLIDKYYEMSLKFKHRINVDLTINYNSQSSEGTNISYIITQMRQDLLSFGYSETDTADMLVREVYGKDSESKMVLWTCFGELLLSNLKQRVNSKEIYCKQCGFRFIPKNKHEQYCENCRNGFPAKSERIVICKDCGKEFVVPNTVHNKTRCNDCQREVNRIRERNKKRLQRARV